LSPDTQQVSNVHADIDGLTDERPVGLGDTGAVIGDFDTVQSMVLDPHVYRFVRTGPTKRKLADQCHSLLRRENSRQAP